MEFFRNPYKDKAKKAEEISALRAKDKRLLKKEEAKINGYT
jgi:hypothetical protein